MVLVFSLRQIRHCEEGAFPDEAISVLLGRLLRAKSKNALAMTIYSRIFLQLPHRKHRPIFTDHLPFMMDGQCADAAFCKRAARHGGAD